MRLHALCIVTLLVLAPCLFADSANAQVLMRSFPAQWGQPSSPAEPEESLPTLEDAQNPTPQQTTEACPTGATQSADQVAGKNNPENDTLKVLGRKGCSITRKYMEELTKAGIAFEFVDIDTPAGDAEFSRQAQAANLYGSIDLPVVVSHGKAAQRPNLAGLLKEYKGTQQASGKDTAPAVAKESAPAPAAQNRLVVYGRKGCSITQKYVAELKQAKIDFDYKDIDNPADYKAFSDCLDKAGISGSVDLPVVDNKGKVAQRPSLAGLLKTNAPAKQEAQAAAKPNQAKKSDPVIIYSMKRCTITKRYMEDLKELDIPFVFKDVDDNAVHKEFSKKMTAAGFSGSVTLPAVVIKGKVYIQPTLTKTMELVQ
ncbi:hypothetical protein JCM14635_20860 [Megalodesulfovibrio paquesii]